MSLLPRASAVHRFAIALTLLGFIAVRSPLWAEPASRPNVLLILVDDMGFADCGFNGGTEIRTPNIDALAREGAILKNYYVQPLCSATRATLMTGRYPIRHGIYGALKVGSKYGLPLQERILPQALREAGYTTAITGKWHLGEFRPAYRPTQRGFDHQYGLWYGQIDYFTHERGGRVDWYRDDQPLDEKGYSTHLIAGEAERLIASQPADKPLFLYVPFNAVHGPFQVPESYREPYRNLPPARQTLAAMLSVVDEAIGSIVKALDEKKLRDHTLIIFSSDNGGVAPGRVTKNTPLRAGKGKIYEGGIRSAAFATWRGKIPAGKAIDAPVHLVDWYPTLLGLGGAVTQQEGPVDGLDIWPLLTTGQSPARDELLLVGTPGNAALRMGDWKLVKHAGEKRPGGTFELFNLATDIAETNDLAATEPERFQRMQARLEALMKDAMKPLGGARDNVE